MREAYLQRPGSHHWAHQVYTNSKEISRRRKDRLRKENLLTPSGHCSPPVKMTLGLATERNPRKVKALCECALSSCSPTACPALHCTLGVPSPGLWGVGVPRGRQAGSSQAREEGRTSVPITSFNPQPPEGGGARRPSYRRALGGPQDSSRAWTAEPELVGVGLTLALPHPPSPNTVTQHPTKFQSEEAA